MPGCDDRNTGVLLHSYELGLLSEEEMARFELHLVTCDGCLHELQILEKAADLLKADNEVNAAIEHELGASGETPSYLGRLLRQLWPARPFILKPAVSYALILMLLGPAYYGLRGPSGPGIEKVGKVIELTATRSITAGAFSKASGDCGMIVFSTRDFEAVESLRVYIESENGSIVYDNPDFRGVEDDDVGRLNLRLTDLEPGKYKLIIEDASSNLETSRRVHLFRVVE